MPIAFLVPAFLAGLALLAVPLLLHLRRRDRRKPVPFPSLMFLERVAVVTDQKRRITDWPLLLLRALAIAILVAAFARPFMKRSVDSVAADAGLTVLLLDRSASMSASESSWADSARAVIDALPTGRRVAVVAYDATATILSAPGADHAAARAAVSSAPSAAGPTRLTAGFRAASQLLASEAVPGEVVVVSDLQQSGVTPGSTVPLPRGTAVRAVMVEPDASDNTAVSSIEIEPVGQGGNPRAVIAARLARFGTGDPGSVAATLEVDGREVATRRVVLESGRMVRVSFDTIGLPREAARVVVRITGDDFTFDDAAYAIAPAESGPRVLLVTAPDARPDEYRYVETALSVPGNPGFQVERTSRPDRESIRRSDLVVLLDAMPTSSEMVEALDGWVRDGGGLLVALGTRMGARRGSSELLHGEVAATRQSADGKSVGLSGASHPALTAFLGDGGEGLSAVRVRRHVEFRPGSDGAVPLRFDDGSAALTTVAHGEGRVAVFAIPVDGRRGDFPLQPAFVPALRGVAEWASGVGREALSITSGSAWQVPANLSAPVIRGPNGDLIRPSGTSRFVTFRESGIHEVMDGGGVAVALVAVNPPASESDLTPMQPDQFLLGIDEVDPATATQGNAVGQVNEASQQWWRWILLLLVVILMVEAWLASSGWRGAAVPATAGDSNGGVA